MVAGSIYWQTDRQKRKEFEGVTAERKAKEKNEAWIKELEARDQEEKEIKAMREARRKGNRGAIGKSGASSMVDEREKRKGVLERVAEFMHGKR